MSTLSQILAEKIANENDEGLLKHSVLSKKFKRQTFYLSLYYTLKKLRKVNACCK